MVWCGRDREEVSGVGEIGRSEWCGRDREEVSGVGEKGRK